MRPTTLTLVSLVFVGFLARVVPHPLNFTPVIAMALVAGVYARPRWLALALPLAAMFLSDLLLNNTVYAAYYEGFRWLGDAGVYVAIGLCAFLPLALKTARGSAWTQKLATGFAGAVLFFAVTNVGVWLSSGMYPLSGAGLAACFAAAVPFFPNTLLSTLLFGAVAVTAMEWRGQRAVRAAGQRVS